MVGACPLDDRGSVNSTLVSGAPSSPEELCNTIIPGIHNEHSWDSQQSGSLRVHKKIYIAVFVRSIFGPDYYAPP